MNNQRLVNLVEFVIQICYGEINCDVDNARMWSKTRICFINYPLFMVWSGLSVELTLYFVLNRNWLTFHYGLYSFSKMDSKNRILIFKAIFPPFACLLCSGFGVKFCNKLKNDGNLGHISNEEGLRSKKCGGGWVIVQSLHSQRVRVCNWPMNHLPMIVIWLLIAKRIVLITLQGSDKCSSYGCTEKKGQDRRSGNSPFPFWPYFCIAFFG